MRKPWRNTDVLLQIILLYFIVLKCYLTGFNTAFRNCDVTSVFSNPKRVLINAYLYYFEILTRFPNSNLFFYVVFVFTWHLFLKSHKSMRTWTTLKIPLFSFVAWWLIFFFNCWILLHFLDEPQFLYPLSYWETSWLLLSFGNYGQIYKHPCTRSCVFILFHLFWQIPRTVIAESSGKFMFDFVRSFHHIWSG